MPQHEMTFHSEHDFPVPPERLYAAMTDVEGYAAWMPNLVRVEKLTDGPVGEGARWREVRRMFGREAGEVFEVREAVPGERLRLYVDGSQGSSRQGEYHFDHTLTETPGGSRLRTDARIVMPANLLTRLVGRMMLGTFRGAIDKDMAALRRHLAA